jgi:hypothetical protein
MAPAPFTATELPHDPGSWTGDDHDPAKAGAAGWTAKAIKPASDARTARPIHRGERARD